MIVIRYRWFVQLEWHQSIRPVKVFHLYSWKIEKTNTNTKKREKDMLESGLRNGNGNGNGNANAKLRFKQINSKN